MRDLESLPNRLGTRSIGRSLTLVESTGSTMDDARAALERGASDGHVVIANEQTSGRGSHGRAWQSPGGDDLYLSLALRPTVPLEQLSTMTLAIGLAVARTVDSFEGGATSRVKWPNDVLVEGAKCAGILVESRATAAGIDGVIVGIGLNCNRAAETLPDGTRITSLAGTSGGRVDRADVAARLFVELERALDVWTADGIASLLPELVSRLAYRDEPIDIDGSSGVLLGLGEDGCLVVRTAAGIESFSAGRVTKRA